jgi:hypothetical protein
MLREVTKHNRRTAAGIWTLFMSDDYRQKDAHDKRVGTSRDIQSDANMSTTRCVDKDTTYSSRCALRCAETGLPHR